MIRGIQPILKSIHPRHFSRVMNKGPFPGAVNARKYSNGISEERMSKARKFIEKHVNASFDEVKEKTANYIANNYGGVIDINAVRHSGPFIGEQHQKWIDGVSAYSVHNIGASHLDLKATAIAYLEKDYTVLSSRAYYNSLLGELGEALAHLSQDLLYAGTNQERINEMAQILPGNGGVDGVETAVKSARKYACDVRGIPDGDQIGIRVEKFFHGRTINAVTGNEDPLMFYGFGCDKNRYHLVPYNDKVALEQAFELYKGRISDMIVEPVQGEGGGVPRRPLISCTCSRTLYSRGGFVNSR